MYKVAITNRRLCSNIVEQISLLRDFDMVILREKDLKEEEYLALARKVLNKHNNIILHSFISVAEKLNYRKIHLPFNIFMENKEILKDYDIVGVSVHCLDEALEAEKNGVDYITASHIFATDCKKGLEPKGLKFLEEICKSVTIPVYALGGINSDNAKSCVDVGAKGVCMMSQAMKITNSQSINE